METYLLSIACKDQKGLIHHITGVLLKYDLNIVSNAEYVERATNSFFMRTEFAGKIDIETVKQLLINVLPAKATVHLTKNEPKNIVILVTKESHCLGDLLIRHHSNELHTHICAVIGNYNHLASLTEHFGIPFVHVGHEEKSREEHENELLKTLAFYNPHYIVLAKYMRILSEKFVAQFPNRIINIHHSFLPAFVGARPYQQAHERGVKIIGATAHFVNNLLDEGPIIAQNVIPVNHSHSAKEMMQAGKDVEKIVLAKALKLVLEEKVFVSQNKTIILE